MSGPAIVATLALVAVLAVGLMVIIPEAMQRDSEEPVEDHPTLPILMALPHSRRHS
jgi:hypothetical protein